MGETESMELPRLVGVDGTVGLPIGVKSTGICIGLGGIARDKSKTRALWIRGRFYGFGMSFFESGLVSCSFFRFPPERFCFVSLSATSETFIVLSLTLSLSLPVA